MTEPALTSGRVAALVLIGAAALVGCAFVFSAHIAIVGMAVFALAGAGARAFGPHRRAFVVRGRVIDVAVLVVFAAALAYLGFTTPLG